MKHFIVVMLLVFATMAFSAPKDLVGVKLSSVGSEQTIASWQVVYVADSVARFVNTNKTIIALYSTVGNRTFTITKPFATMNVPGVGVVTVSDLVYVVPFGKMTFAQVPTYYAVAGRVSVKSDSIAGGRIQVMRID